MKKEIYLIKLKQEVLDSVKYFELESNDYLFGTPHLDEENLSEIDIFFESIQSLEIKDIFAKVEEKYGWLLNFYREDKRNNNINIIRKISIYFLIISIISIILGIFLWIK